MWEGDLSPYGVALVFDDDRARLELSGASDVATGVALVDAATSAIARYRWVEIDLGAVTSMDDAALRALVKVKRFADAYDAVLVLTGAHGGIADLLASTGVGVELGLTLGPS